MSVPSTPLGIIVGVDGSPSSIAAVDWAAGDARLRDLPLTLVHAAPARAISWRLAISLRIFGEVRELPHQRIRRIIDDAISRVDDTATPGRPLQVSIRVVFTDPDTALVDLSREAEMVVVGERRRHALRSRRRGSVSSMLVHQSHCPVAVIHDEDPLMPHPAQAPVLLANSDSSASEHAKLLAEKEAQRRGVDLVISGGSASQLVKKSEAAQLVVVGNSHHHSPVGETVAHAARTPVIVTP